MLILKNVTAVQLHPAKVQEGVDIAIENDVIVAIGDALTQRYPDASYKEMHGRIVMPGIVCFTSLRWRTTLMALCVSSSNPAWDGVPFDLPNPR